MSNLGGLLHGFVRERTGARHNSDAALFMNMTRHDADLALLRGDDPGTVRPDKTGNVLPEEFVFHTYHVLKVYNFDLAWMPNYDAFL